MTRTTARMITTPYPYSQSNSGILEKFIPYHPVISVRGMKTVVTIVRNCMILFCR